MATTNETVGIPTRHKQEYSIAVTEFNGHTVALEFLNSSGNWKPIKDDSGTDIIETADFQGVFTAPSEKIRLNVTPGTGDFDYLITSTSDQ